MSNICQKCGSGNFDNSGNCLYCLTQELKWLKSGTILDNRYEIKKALKAGGMGAVYKGYDRRLSQTCAVKEMLNEDENERDYMKGRFMEEAKLLADLRHQGIPRVTDYFTHNNRYYLIMDYLEGYDLYSYLSDVAGNKGLDEKTVIKWGIEVCNILIYLHGQEPNPILHRDIKPSNIFLCKDGRIMLIDFGLARPINPNSKTEKTVIGTMGYAPMEQYQGHPEPRSDIYSLGASMHFLLSAIEPAPFKFQPLKNIRSDISEGLDFIIKKALNLYPENRFSSALELKEVLENKRELGNYKDDSGELDKVQLEIAPHLNNLTGKGLFTKKHISPKINTLPSFNLSDPLEIDKIFDFAAKSDTRAIEPLISMLNSEDFAHKYREIITFLGNFKDERAVEPLIKMLSSKDETIRRYVPVALAGIGSKKAVPALGILLKDQSLAVRKSALKAMGEIIMEKENMNFLALFLTRDKKEYIDRLPEDHSLYFDTIDELAVNLAEKNELLRCYVHLAVLYEADGKYFEAETSIKKALEIDQDEISILLIYVRILNKLNKYSESKKYMEKILSIKKNDKELNLLYAEILLKLKDYSEAIEIYYDIYIELREDDLEDKLREIYYDYGKELDLDNKPEEALEEYKKAFFLNPGYKERDFFEALILFKEKKYSKSLKTLNKYIEEHRNGAWYNQSQELLEEIKKSPFPGVVSWIKGLWN